MTTCLYPCLGCLTLIFVKDRQMLHKNKKPQAAQDSISDLQYCVNRNICPKTSYNRRKSGKMPPHFLHGKQVRYLLSDIEAFEQSQQLKTNAQ